MYVLSDKCQTSYFLDQIIKTAAEQGVFHQHYPPPFTHDDGRLTSIHPFLFFSLAPPFANIIGFYDEVAETARVASQLDVFLAVFEHCLHECIVSDDEAQFVTHASRVGRLASHAMAGYIVSQSFVNSALERTAPETARRTALQRVADHLEAAAIQRWVVWHESKDARETFAHNRFLSALGPLAVATLCQLTTSLCRRPNIHQRPWPKCAVCFKRPACTCLMYTSYTNCSRGEVDAFGDFWPDVLVREAENASTYLFRLF